LLQRFVFRWIFSLAVFFLSFSFLKATPKLQKISQGLPALDFAPLIQIPVSPSNSLVFVHLSKNQFPVFTLQ